MRNGYLYDGDGNRSSSRLIVFIVIIVSLIYSGAVLWMGRDDVTKATIAAGTLFTTMAGPAMTFLFFQKSNEIKAKKS